MRRDPTDDHRSATTSPKALTKNLRLTYIYSMAIAVKTISCKLQPTPEQAAAIDATLVAFADAATYAAGVCVAIGSTNRFEVHHACYNDIRSSFKLPANLVCQAIARACSASKTAKTAPTFAPTSISYDSQIFRLIQGKWLFSVSLLGGRHKIATSLGDFQRQRLVGKQPTSATLVKRPGGGGYYLNVQVKETIAEPEPVADFIGVDLGVANLAVDSDGEIHSGDDVEAVRRKHTLQRKRLQRKGTRGAKKKLRRLAGKEARFRRYENHCISKTLVETAKRTGRGIALEKLKGIRDRVTAWGGDAKARLSGWAFAQLRCFIEYKALAAGVVVAMVDAAYSSRTCSECGHCDKASRKSQALFRCVGCGYECHADWNAARNHRAQAIRKLASELPLS